MHTLPMSHGHVMQLELRWYQHSAVVEVTELTRNLAETDSGVCPDVDSELEFELESHFELMLND